MATKINVKIAEWLGWKWNTPPVHRKNNWMAMWDPYWTDETGNSVASPYFDRSDASAIILFPVLVAKGFTPLLHRHVDGWSVQIWGAPELLAEERLKSDGKGETICSAISEAVLKLIESI